MAFAAHGRRRLTAAAARAAGAARAAAAARAPALLPVWSLAASSAHAADVCAAPLAASLLPFAMRGVSTSSLKPLDTFERRHNSIREAEADEMARFVGFENVDALVDATVPAAIRRHDGMPLASQYHEGMTESEALAYIKGLASENKVMKSFIGQGYHGTLCPPVILRNVLENPGWYTQYTPYQAEIAQGRLESLLNFQTMVADLTAMPLCNSSLLDEATAAAEAMTMCSAIARGKKPKFLVSDKCHPQTIAVCQTRADGLGLEVVVGDHESFDYSGNDVCGMLLQYPATDGGVLDYSAAIDKAKAAKTQVVMSADLLALTVLAPPGELGADMVVGSTQRFGVPMGYGGPHAAFLATTDKNKRLMPGRIIGVSVDADGNRALRMAMQTREQHIRRDKATSNICTAQALLANIAALYGVYHGPQGLRQIAERCHGLAAVFAAGAEKLGHSVSTPEFFDAVTVEVGDADGVMASALASGMNLRRMSATAVHVNMDETTKLEDLDALFAALNGGEAAPFTAAELAPSVDAPLPRGLERTSDFMTQDVFNTYHNEHEMVRYLAKLESRDLSLVHSMIPLGSCTMKLNATSEMMPVTWPELADIHPFAPLDQAQGYAKIIKDLDEMLCTITGFDALSMQPNSGATGEYAGLMSIRAYHRSRGDAHRDVCIIPKSAHGTNPASAVMSGMSVVAVGTDDKGNINIDELRAAAEKHSDRLAALMITYPSTHGVYEEGVDEICRIIHDNGGQVYMDGANMNAQVGLTSPGHIGADVCHLNLHKTFCIPHGGGGPGMGPIGMKAHLAPFMSDHPIVPGVGGEQSFGPVAAAPWGSSMILPISYMYIAMMGSKGLKRASELAMLNANYMAKRLDDYYPVLFRGENGTCAHEFIIDLRPLKASAEVEAEDIAKRLIDYGFHAPTMSWPVSGTLMIEPTESESKAELDRFCDAMIAIRGEIKQVEEGKVALANSPLKNAPHPAAMVTAEEWPYPYSRETAAFPAPWVKDAKFWPTTRRVDNVYGDRNLVTTLTEVAEEKVQAFA